jgi:enolase-phosphatase E1
MTLAVLTDIEGTTSSLAFVKDVLFPYARRALPDYVHDYADQVAALLGDDSSTPEQMVATLLQWMDEDRKVTALKTIEGLIWQSGYDNGELEGHIYDDAVRGLRRWHEEGLALYVYSSGSVSAQKLLFANTAHGDLTYLFSGYFDTTVGSKLEASSYAKIATALGLAPLDIAFLTDNVEELRAAQAAGLHTVMIARDAKSTGNFAHNFDEITLPRPLR